MNRAHFENKIVSRNFFIFLWATYALVYMTKNCFSAALASIVSEGVMTKGQTGLITAVFYVIYAPLQVLGGILADKRDPEKLIKYSLIFSGIANLVIFFNQNYYVMLAAWAFNAVSQFAIWPAIFKIVSSQLVRSDRKSAAFYISFSSSAGLLLAFLTAAVITKWQINFLISAILLISLGISMHFVCKKVDRYFVSDRPVIEVKKVDARKDGFDSASHIFLMSGFYIFAVVAFLRTVVELGTKAYAPTMLMESYDGVTPSLGNLINIVIIITGILGTLTVRYLFTKKIIKTELGGSLMLLVFAIPFSVLVMFIGKIHAVFSIVSMCIMIFLLTAINLLSSYFNMNFAKYGKSGAAAGILNAAASFGVVFQSFGIGTVADSFGWRTVGIIFAAFILLSAVLVFFMIPVWDRYKRKTY